MTTENIFSQEAEEALIGLVIGSPADYRTINLDPNHFYVHRYRLIWSTIGDLLQRGIGVDLVTLVDELARNNHLGEVGGMSELTRLIGSYPYGLNIDDTADLIRDYAARRGLVQMANDMAKLAYNRQANISEHSAEFIDRLARLSMSKDGAIPWSSYLSELKAEIEYKQAHPTNTWGIPTGFTRFDRITGGAQKGESIIFSGKPGVGKSMLAMQMGKNMAKQEPGVIYSIEMKGSQVARRFLSASTKIFSSRLKSGSIEEKDWRDINKSLNELGSLPVFMSDSVGWTTTALRADLARLKAVHNIGWFVFDYLMLAGDAPNLDKTERSEIISRNMKLICRDLDLAGIVVHSMNKAGIDAVRPDQANLSGSAQVSFDADLICFLMEFKAMSTRDGLIKPDEQANMRTLFFAKGRELEDPAKYMHLVKLPHLPEFGDYAPDIEKANNSWTDH